MSEGMPRPADAAEVLSFWFGDARPIAARAEWFRKDRAFDAAIAERFGPRIEAALGGGLRDWDATPEGALARIVLLDQFTRNVFRDTPRAFAGDALALAAARSLLADRRERALAPLQRAFAYLPFEHDESMASQRESVARFAELASEHPGDATLASMLDYAHRHAAVIERFGRFPHRNVILGRASTAEETAYLAQPGSGF